MTITSNIHIGLAGWSNATYTVGQRRSNGGNAYQVITGGTSTSPPTGTGSNIVPGGTSHWKWLSAIDYTDPQTWATAIPATLTQPIIGVFWNDGVISPSYAQPWVWFTGHTTTSTNTITLMPASGEGFKAATPTTAYAYNAANGVAVAWPTSGTSATPGIRVDDNFVIIDGLQLSNQNPTPSQAIIGGSWANLTIRNCIIDGFATDGVNLIFGTGNNPSMTNNLIIDRTTDSTETVSFFGSTGVVAANNTFVAINVNSFQAAISCGTNTTTATCSATNNIFINYNDVAFAADSGTPWVTNHNFYTATSFGASFGTDTGGSVYSITTAATFVSYPTDFHVKAGAPVLNLGATDTTDIPSATDAFGTSRPQGSAWDGGAHELLVGTVIFRDVVASVAFGTSRVANASVPTEFRLSVGFSAIGSPIEWRGGVFLDYAISSDWRSSFTVDRLGPVEWLMGTRSVTADAGITLEWRSAYALDQTAPTEWSAVRMADANMPVAWQRSYSVDAPAPIDWRASLVRDVGVAIDWASPFVVSDSVLSVDWKASPVRDAVVAAESGLSVAQTAAVPIETSSLRIVDATVSADPGTTGRLDAALASEWSAGLAISVATPLETVLAVMRDAQAPVETNLAVVLDGAMQAGHELNLARDAVLWIEPLVGIAADARAPMEFGGSTVSGNAAVPVEWRSGIFQDVTAPAEMRATFRVDALLPIEASFPHVIDAPFGIAWGAGIVVDAAIPVELGHQLLSVTTDTAFPLEIQATIAADIVVPIMVDIGREAIGSALEPDQFEDDHEP